MRRWVMARVIEFYVPQNFRPNRQWVPADQRGKVVSFPRSAVKSSVLYRKESGTMRIFRFTEPGCIKHPAPHPGRAVK